MIVYLSGTKSLQKLFEKHNKNFNKMLKTYKPYILESFYYADSKTPEIIKNCGGFILDSGAFTFSSANGEKQIDWVDYIKKYAQFINDNNIDKFFELDIDYLIGYEKVKEYRDLLNTLTKKKCIPVWHKCRGIQEYYKMCEEYDYIAIGASGRNEDSKWLRKNPHAFQQLIKIAHLKGCKVHGLGFTDIRHLKNIKLDSVDSTTWLSASRYGECSKFNNGIIEKSKPPKGKKLLNHEEMDINNFMEWVKFQKYAERRL